MAEKPGERLEDEHHSITECIRTLEQTMSLPDVERMAEELEAALDEHFAFEESSDDGLPALVRDHAPVLFGRCERLMGEHPAIRAAAERLAKLAHETIAQKEHLIELIRVHEREEADLLSQALYEDIGGSG